MEKKIDYITQSFPQNFLKNKLKNLARENPNNANVICDYIIVLIVTEDFSPIYSLIIMIFIIMLLSISPSITMKCRSCLYQFDPFKEGNSRKRKCGICCFGDSYSVRSKKEYERDLLFMMIESQQ